MYAELKLKPFVSITQPAITEAPCSIIPPNADTVDDSTAIDLTIKHSKEECDNSSTIGYPGESSFDDNTLIKSIAKKVSTETVTSEDDSDNISESILSTSASRKYPSSTRDVTSTENNHDILFVNESMESHTHIESFESSTGRVDELNNNMENLNMFGRNLPDNHEFESVVQGINQSPKNPEDIVLGTNTNLKICNSENVTRTGIRQNSNSPCHPVRIEKYSDAKLNGTLEQLNASEVSTINTLAELSFSTIVLNDMDKAGKYNSIDSLVVELNLNDDHTSILQTVKSINHNYCSDGNRIMKKTVPMENTNDPALMQLDISQSYHDSEDCIIDLAANDLLLAPDTPVIDVSHQMNNISNPSDVPGIDKEDNAHHSQLLSKLSNRNYCQSRSDGHKHANDHKFIQH